MTLVPAYGRDYKSVEEIKAALKAGNVDFQCCDVISGGGYVTGKELLTAGKTSINVRYKQQRSVAVIDLRKLEPKKPRAKKAKSSPVVDETTHYRSEG